MTESGFVKGQSDNLPKIDAFMMTAYFASNPDFTCAEIKGVKASSDNIGGHAHLGPRAFVAETEGSGDNTTNKSEATHKVDDSVDFCPRDQDFHTSHIKLTTSIEHAETFCSSEEGIAPVRAQQELINITTSSIGECVGQETKYIVYVDKNLNMASWETNSPEAGSGEQESYTVHGEAVAAPLATVSRHDRDSPKHYHLYKLEPRHDEVWVASAVAAGDGVVVGGAVWLPALHWHALQPAPDARLLACKLCATYCEREAWAEHAASAAHCRRLRACPPLRLYDLAVVRKIQAALHCGVCNELVSTEDGAWAEHEGMRSHELALLRSTNKLCDLGLPSHRNQGEYHFHAATLQQPAWSWEHSADDDEEEYEDKENEEEEFDDEEEEELEEYEPPQPGVSYAAVAKKPVERLPEFINIELGSRTVKVRFSAWHMLAGMRGARNFYCMACACAEPARSVAAHVAGAAHATRLAACRVLPAPPPLLIRAVDTRWFHCAHCNVVQWRDQLEDHVAARHPLPARNYVERGAVIRAEAAETARPAPPPPPPEFDVFGDIPLSPFGSPLRIPALHFNLVMRRGADWWCALCERTCPDVRAHVDERDHVELMTVAPYIRFYHNHLIRAVRGELHCSLCNELVAAAAVGEHNLQPAHTAALAAALGLRPSSAQLASGGHPPAPSSPLHGGVPNRVQQSKSLMSPHTPPLQQVPSATVGASARPTNDVNIGAIKSIPPMFHAMFPRLSTSAAPAYPPRPPPAASPAFPPRPPPAASPAPPSPSRPLSYDSHREMERKTLIITDKKEPAGSQPGAGGEPPSPPRSPGGAGSDDEDEDRSDASHELEHFDEFEMVIVKYKNDYYKITNGSYHTLVFQDNGLRYCFVCAHSVRVSEASRHVTSRAHLVALAAAAFLDKHAPLYRQMYLTYHCGVCNVMVSRRALSRHAEWPPHAEAHDQHRLRATKGLRRELRAGLKEYCAATKREAIFNKMSEPECHVRARYLLAPHHAAAPGESVAGEGQASGRKSKLVIQQDCVLKLSFEQWHGIARGGERCALCRRDLLPAPAALLEHVASDEHAAALARLPLPQYKPALIRQIDDAWVHCMSCNVEVCGERALVQEHARGRKHLQRLQELREQAAAPSASYHDCYHEILQL